MCLEDFEENVLGFNYIAWHQDDFLSALIKTRDLFTFVYKYILEHKVCFTSDAEDVRDLLSILTREDIISLGLCSFFGIYSMFRSEWRKIWTDNFSEVKWYKDNDMCLFGDDIDQLVIYLYYRIGLLNKCIELTEKGK